MVSLAAFSQFCKCRGSSCSYVPLSLALKAAHRETIIYITRAEISSTIQRMYGILYQMVSNYIRNTVHHVGNLPYEEVAVE